MHQHKTKTLALLTVTDPFTTVVNITRPGRGTGPDIRKLKGRKLKLTKRTTQRKSMSKKSDSEDPPRELEVRFSVLQSPSRQESSTPSALSLPGAPGGPHRQLLPPLTSPRSA